MHVLQNILKEESSHLLHLPVSEFEINFFFIIETFVRIISPTFCKSLNNSRKLLIGIFSQRGHICLLNVIQIPAVLSLISGVAKTQVLPYNASG